MGIFLGGGKETRAASPWAGEPPIQVNPAGTAGSSGGDPLTVPTVWACVSLLANAVSMLPLETFRLADGVPRPVSNPWLSAPADGMTQSEWLHMIMVSLLLRGNAIGVVTARDGREMPLAVELLNPDDVQVMADPSGQLQYKIRRTGQQLAKQDVWHVRGLTLPGSKVGLSPISYAAALIGVDLSSRQFARDFFDGGGVPKALVYSDQILEQDQARSIKDRILAATGRREPLVLPSGLKYEKISVSPDESQFLATQQANVGQIARFFNIPAGMVGGSEGGSMTYANVEQRGIDFLTYSVQFWLKRIEDSVFPMLPQPVFARFNTEALLRTDAETQAKVDNMRIAGKVIVGSEARAKMGLPPFTPEQQAEAEMGPLTVTPSGAPKALVPNAQGPEAPVPAAEAMQQNSAPQWHLHLGDTNVEVQPAPPAEVRQQINVAPAAAPEVRQEIHVAPAAVSVPVNVAPSSSEVRLVPAPVGKRTKRVERNSQGDVVAIIEE